MDIPSLEDVDNSRLLEPGTLKEILQDISTAGTGQFALEGSLLDYKIDTYPHVMQFKATQKGIKYKLDTNWPSGFPDESIAEAQNRTRDAFLRSGGTTHPNLDEVMAELRSQDDVIIGVDGNILHDCILTSALLKEIYAEKFPNWILIAIPRLVMSGIESSAKDEFEEGDHPRIGWPTYQGRAGQRALQEVINLREQNPDRPGLAMMTIGDLREAGAEVDPDGWKSDAKVRDQFKNYLDDIGFHKGTYFLSQNRVNVMMSSTEGGDALYLQKPEFDDVETGTLPVDAFADLIYELCVQFGSLRLKGGDAEELLVELSSYWPGKQVSDWTQGKLNVVSVHH